MARVESTAIAGYFATPQHLVPRIAGLLGPAEEGAYVSVMDPCAGEGAAVFGLLDALQVGKSAELFACEMESTRFAKLEEVAKKRAYALSKHLIHGDAFHLTYKMGYRHGVSVLYLNPPYDFDRDCERLEHKFLMRFTSALMIGGALLFVVPYYALHASATYLATHYDNIHCFRFPKPDFDGFKQVVLFAQRCESRLAPDAQLVKKVTGYSRPATRLPELPATPKPLAALASAGQYEIGLNEWRLMRLDTAALAAKAKPWVNKRRQGVETAVRGVLPDLPISDLLLRRYPVATPPRPAHIAAGMAAGIFNGMRVGPDHPATGLPPILVKGVFTQEYRTIEEKVSEDGDLTMVQVQQPKLIVTALDLSTHKYHTLKTGTDTTPAIAELTVAGLLEHYGQGLMQVMEAQCPILYDPRRDSSAIKLAKTHRKPFKAQAHAAKAIVKLLGGPGLPLQQRRGKTAILLGEIGSGKSTVALTVSKTVNARRPLIICPPHLLKSWRDEIAAVIPQAKVRVLTSVAEVEAVAQDNSAEMVISILSRETAKLTHGWEGVGRRCPKCGAITPPTADQAKHRLHCKAQEWVAETPVAKLVLVLARKLARHDHQDATIKHLLTGYWDRRSMAFYKKRNDSPEFGGLPAGLFTESLDWLLQPNGFEDDAVRRAVTWALAAANSQELIARIAEHYLSCLGYGDQDYGRQLLGLLDPGGAVRAEIVEKYSAKQSSAHYNPWASYQRASEGSIRVAGLDVCWSAEGLSIAGKPAGSLDTAKSALAALVRVSGLERGPECGQVLFHAVPEPRRVALGKHIAQRYPKTFDFLVLDEAHEAQNQDSAQSMAAQRLASLRLPCIQMTGSIMGGYAASFFALMQMASPEFRAEFKRSDLQRFIDRYGYRKRVVTEKAGEKSVVEFGANSDRVIRNERIVGSAPGVLPLFVLKHLLPLAVTLHKSDLALELPACVQERHLVRPTPELQDRYAALERMLADQIKQDQFDPDLSGKLFGQLAELPSYLDRATSDTGNTEHGAYEIRYPASVGGALIGGFDPLPASTILPKEQWMLDRVKQELAEGRNVMVFSWHVALLPRLAKLISKATGLKVPILHADKVPTATRQQWIEDHVIGKGARILCVNPLAVSTGLNSLVRFSTEIWMENPGCNAILYRQAVGRVDRIGQRLQTRILFPVYEGTLQEALHDLLLQKVAVSTAADGLDPESALASVGLGQDEFLTGLSIGKQLWAILSKDTPMELAATG